MKKISLFFSFLTLALILVSCSLLGNNNKGTYYLYEKGVKNERSFITLEKKTWVDSENLSGKYVINGDEIKLFADFFGEEVEMLSGTINNGIIIFSLLGSQTIYALDGKMPELQTQYTLDITDNNLSKTEDGYKMLIDESASSYDFTKSFKVNDEVGWYLSSTSDGKNRLKTNDVKLKYNVTSFYIIVYDQFYDVILNSIVVTINKDVSMRVNFYDYNGNMLETKHVKNGQKIDSSPDSIVNVPVGYHFYGWSFYKGTAELIDFETYYVDSDINLYPIVKANDYQITLRIDGELNNTKVNVVYDEYFTIDVPENIPGYRFVGWKYNDTLITDHEGNSKSNYRFSSNINVDAQWIETKYKFSTLLEYDSAGKILEGPIVPTNYEYNELVRINLSVNQGYEFLGWYENDKLISDSLYHDFYMPARDLVYIAKFSTQTFEINYDLGRNGENDERNPETYNKDTSRIYLYDATQDFHTFEGWYINGYKVTYIDPKSYLTDITVTARFSAYTYNVELRTDLVSTNTISFNPNGGDGEIIDRVVDESTSLELPTNPKRSGYVFVSWHQSQLTNDSPFDFSKNINKDIMLYAKWQKVVGSSIVYTDSTTLSYSSSSTVTYWVSVANNDKLDISLNYNSSYQTFSLYNSSGSQIVSGRTSYSIQSPGLYQIVVSIRSSYYYTYTMTLNKSATSPTLRSQNVVNTKATYYERPTFGTTTRKGLSFDGWYTEPAGKGTKVTDEFGRVIDPWEFENIVLYAYFKDANYNIKYHFKISNSSYYNNNNINEYKELKDDYYLSYPELSNYTFEGWYTDNLYQNKIEYIKKGQWGNINLYAKTEPIKYNISYDLKGGVSDVTLVNNFTVESDFNLSKPTKTGYNFLGWYDENDKKIDRINSGTSGSMFLTAKFELATYKITYILNGGTNNSNNQTEYRYTDSNITLYEPTREHYVFKGWYEDIAMSRLVKNIPAGSVNNKTLYAKFEAVNYVITLNVNGGILSNTSINYNIETNTNLPIPTRTGYTFVGWFDSQIEGNKVDKIQSGTSGNKTYYARWEVTDFKVTYVLPGAINHIDNPATFKYTDEEYILKNPTKTHFEFQGWYSNSNFTNQIIKINKYSHSDITLYAKFVATKYEIKFETNGGRTVPSITYDIETDRDLPIPTKDGYVFLGWYKDEEFINKLTRLNVGSNGNFTLYAKFEIEKYLITYNLDGGTNDKDNPSYYEYNGSEIILKNAVKSNYDFLGWYDGNNEVKKISNTQKGNISLTARYIAHKYEIIYNTLGGNKISSETYTYNTYQVINKQPTKEGSKFLGWYDKSELGNKITDIVVGTTGNIELFARWELEEYTITYILNNGINHENNITKIKYGDEKFILNKASRNGYDFIGWYTSNTNGLLVTELEEVSSNITLYARYQAITYDIYYYNELNELVPLVKYKTDSVTKLPNINTKPGYTFVGYYDQKEAGNKIVETLIGEYGDKYLYPRYTLTNYLLTFNLNGGILLDSNPSSYTFEDDIEFNKPTKIGYIFTGWFTSNYGGTEIKGVSAGKNTTNYVLYARWEVEKYSITYELDGGTYSSINNNDFSISKTVNFYNAEKTGYTFVGWYDKPELGNKISSTRNIYNDIIVYARFNIINNTLSLNLDGGIFEDEKDDIKSFTVLDHIILPIPVKEGYKFIEWTENGINIKEIPLGTTSAKTIKANWEIINYNIVYNLSGGINSNLNKDKYTIEMDLTLFDPIKTGYTFNGWYDNADFIGDKIEIIKKGTKELIELHAKFNPNPHYIQFITHADSTKHGLMTVYTDEAFELPLPKREYYSFVSWYINSERTDPYNESIMSPNSEEEITLYDGWTEYDLRNRYEAESVYNLSINFKEQSINEILSSLGVYFIDTDGNDFDYELVSIHEGVLGGTTIKIVFNAKSKRERKEGGIIQYLNVELNNVMIYDIPEISLDLDKLNIKEINDGFELTPEYFNATAKDSFGNKLDVEVNITNKIPGDITKIIISTTDAAKNEKIIIIENVKYYGNPTITFDESISEIKLSDINNLEEILNIKAKDSFGEELKVTLTLPVEEFKGGETFKIKIQAIDHLGNETQIDTHEIFVYDVPELIRNEDIDKIYYQDDIIEIFEISGFDTKKEPIDVTYTIEGEFLSGEIINITFMAKDHLGQEVILVIEGVKVYGKPKFNIKGNTNIRSNQLEGEFNFTKFIEENLEVSIKDDFNQLLEYSNDFDYSEMSNMILSLIFITENIKGEKVSYSLKLKVYDEITRFEITNDIIRNVSIISEGRNHSLKVYDSFGDEITNIVILDHEGNNVKAGSEIEIMYRATDVAGNYLDIKISNKVKIYGNPIIEMRKDLTAINVGTEINNNWFRVTDSFDSNINFNYEILEGNINEPGTIKIRVFATSYGNESEMIYEIDVLETYEISFDTNNLFTYETIILNENEIKSYVLPIPEVEGYIFKGWFVKELKITSLDDITENTTLNAEFELIEYSITYEGAIPPDNSLTKFTVLREGSLPEVSKEGYIFKGWYVKEDETKAIISLANLELKNTILVAHYEIEKYSITYEGDILPDEYLTTFTVLREGSLPEVSKEGYIFKGWYVKEDETKAIISLENLELKDTILVALFQEIINN